MLEFKNIKTYDLRESVISCRNSMRLDIPEYNDEEFEKAISRAEKLVKMGGGSGQTNFRSGIRVAFDMKYTQYITKQFQRYHWFDYISSSSMMHRITKMDFGKCCNKYVTYPMMEHMKMMIEEYNYIIENKLERDEWYDMKGAIITHTFEGTRYVAFMRIISNCPMGAELFVRVNTNYEQLATICRQRKGHKLKEDWDAFFEMVRSLPYAEQLIPECYGND